MANAEGWRIPDFDDLMRMRSFEIEFTDDEYDAATVKSKSPGRSAGGFRSRMCSS